MTDFSKLLALETATLEVGAAVFERDRVVWSVSTRPGRLHVETLHPAIERVLLDSDTDPSELDAIAVDVGPGLFTGLRVGIAAAKAVALALSVPIAAVRSTEALKEMARRVLGDDVSIVPLVDMRRGEVAWEIEDGVLEFGTIATMVRRLAPDANVRLVGDGTRRLGDELASLPHVEVVADEALWAPSVEAVGLIGADRLRRGLVTDAVSLEPVYLRPADAVANFQTRESSMFGTPR
ncbi:MAG: tRNA (adenosine(37)-N6)-threonylcarbamoyltransferase complex dimerization subunit type 1 TsaB [Acidimicrobiales bacterium]